MINSKINNTRSLKSTREEYSRMSTRVRFLPLHVTYDRDDMSEEFTVVHCKVQYSNKFAIHRSLDLIRCPILKVSESSLS